MIDKLVNHIVRFKKIWGVHIEELTEGVFQIDAILLEYKKGAVFIREKKQASELEALSFLVRRKIPVSLSYSGPRVLYKIAESVQATGIEDILHGSEPEDFYTQYFDSGASRFFAVVRKQQMEPIFSAIKGLGITIVGLSLGPAALTTLAPFIGTSEVSEVYAGLFCIRFSKGKLSDITKEPRTRETAVVIADESLHSGELIPYANALSMFSQYGESLNSSWSHIGQEARHKMFFRFAFPVSLAVVFSILLVSFLTFQLKTQEYDDLSFRLSGYRKQLNQLEKLKKDFQDKQVIQSNIKLNNSLFLSYYADRIAKTVPPRIQLTTLLINPVKSSALGFRQGFQYEQGKIRLSGVCSSPVELNRWLSTIRELDFVGNVENQTYQFDSKEGKGVFELTLKVSTP